MCLWYHSQRQRCLINKFMWYHSSLFVEAIKHCIVLWYHKIFHCCIMHIYNTQPCVSWWYIEIIFHMSDCCMNRNQCFIVVCFTDCFIVLWYHFHFILKFDCVFIHNKTRCLSATLICLKSTDFYKIDRFMFRSNLFSFYVGWLCGVSYLSGCMHILRLFLH